MTKVYKFGGASVKDANAVKNVGTIIQLNHDNLVVVISAMGKTTNGLEKVVEAYFNRDKKCVAYLADVKKYHFDILNDLFENKQHPVFTEIHNTFIEIEWEIETEPTREYDYVYDQIVAVGELLSTKIVSAYLNEVSIKNTWVDVRAIIQTDNTYRNAKINWTLTEQLTQKIIQPLFDKKEQTIVITQGFIGSSSELFTTTLGREGSDFTAGILAYCINAESVTIWKDVPGMLNADPKWFDDTKKIDNISYHEAVELAYYGASVIHPKTIKPLHNKNIPLYIKSFVSPHEEGTLINNNTIKDEAIPSFIFKMNQVLISISAKDYSFIIEDNLSQIFGVFANLGITINLMQNSAISFSVCVDFDAQKTKRLIEILRKDYKILYNENLELVTIRHYDQQTIDRVTLHKKIMVEQKSRNTARLVMKN
ncbi:MAG: aspartate kinase [Bacteroidetes bacterium RIFCSPLOWO2_12_FULL_31_6]|nr:MAG: aspartate kinase [Bacteroidetes bacterium RIFCSPLOWO2_12_FULL_31_6]